jgi:hypothetical protein
VNLRFGGTYRLHLQGRKNQRPSNQREQVAADWLLAHEFFYSDIDLFGDGEDQ